MSYPFTKYVLSTIGYSVALLVSLFCAPTIWAQSCHSSSSGSSTKTHKNPELYVRKVSAATQVNHRPSTTPNMGSVNRPPVDSMQHGICPVMDQPLGQHGTPIELSVYGRQMFVCCEDCVREVEQHPEVYLRKMAASTQNDSFPPPQARIAVSRATRADIAAVKAQGYCPVMNQPLGNRETPVKVEIDGRPLYVCCKDCVTKVETNPDLYLAKVVRGQQPDPPGSQNPWFLRPEKRSSGGSGGSCCSSRSGGGSSCH